MSRMSRNIARIHILPELVRELFHMPPGTRIVGACITENSELELTIEHPDLYLQDEGVTPPLISPLVKRPAETIVWDWNQT